MAIVGVEVDALAGVVSELIQNFRTGSFGGGFLPLPDLGSAPAIPADYDVHWDLSSPARAATTDAPIQDLSPEAADALVRDQPPGAASIPTTATGRVAVRVSRDLPD